MKTEVSFHVTYEYSNGVEGVRDFKTREEIVKWAWTEGDHLVDYTVHPVMIEKP